MLLELRHYLQHHGLVSLAELSTQFKTPPDTLAPMLQTFIRKGQLCELAKTSACGTRCQQCPTAQTQLYRWQESK